MQIPLLPQMSVAYALGITRRNADKTNVADNFPDSETNRRLQKKSADELADELAAELKLVFGSASALRNHESASVSENSHS